ncbi:putative pre-mRNA-splicing factor ATP-dependent RNA helicase [Acorus calamus]|uniref:RNA helicase n=1 Tax=Acorus calamus TaxID=4465 RepID=A0AAV9F219_ACOCL|nr:putative pre-mRNA-splicing factor ATP-dependent RNA helicase [Acorus calamus]
MAQFWKPGSERPRAVILDDEEGGVLFFSAAPSISGYGYASLERQRQRLPVFKHRTAILYLVESHATTIIVGETGSGKTTQIPQYLKEAGWAEGGRMVACTQPRRLAVQSVATRVAEEMGVKLGEEVGYTIRFEDITTPGVTMIKFLTDGVLLREMMNDPLLTKYRKKRQEQASENCAPSTQPGILSVEGQGFVVEISYLEEPAPDYLQAAEPMGDILVFLTGQDDIDAAVQLLTENAQKRGKHSSGMLVLPLYSGLSRADQDLVFSPMPKGKRKVVISTNIAETSLTLEITNIENLVVAPISKASAKQRAGRAGRVRPGKCFRLYTEEYFVKEMPAEGIPEMQRSNLVSSVIQSSFLVSEPCIFHASASEIHELKALGIDNILGFDWLASPSPESMIRALEVLYSLGVLDEDAKLTSPTGFQVAEIPLDPMISKMILSSNELGCSEEIITIAAILSIQSIWVSGRGSQKELDEARLRFSVAEGDHITYLNVYQGFLRSGKSSQWCHKNFINYQAMKKVVEIREQLRKLMKQLGHKEGKSLLDFLPMLVVLKVNPKWMVYHSLVLTEKHYMRNQGSMGGLSQGETEAINRDRVVFTLATPQSSRPLSHAYLEKEFHKLSK